MLPGILHVLVSLNGAYREDVVTRGLSCDINLFRTARSRLLPANGKNGKFFTSRFCIIFY